MNHFIMDHGSRFIGERSAMKVSSPPSDTALVDARAFYCQDFAGATGSRDEFRILVEN